MRQITNLNIRMGSQDVSRGSLGGDGGDGDPRMFGDKQDFKKGPVRVNRITRMMRND